MRTICKAKIHGVRITETVLEYEGSITLPLDLIRQANIAPYERVQIVNLSNGNRIETYVIPGKEGSDTICLNGPAARTAMVGDKVHILSYALVDDKELEGFNIRMLYLDEKNSVKKTKEVSVDTGNT